MSDNTCEECGLNWLTVNARSFVQIAKPRIVARPQELQGLKMKSRFVCPVGVIW